MGFTATRASRRILRQRCRYGASPDHEWMAGASRWQERIADRRIGENDTSKNEAMGRVRKLGFAVEIAIAVVKLVIDVRKPGARVSHPRRLPIQSARPIAHARITERGPALRFDSIQDAERALIARVETIGENQAIVAESLAQLATKFDDTIAVDVDPADDSRVGDAIRIRVRCATALFVEQSVPQHIERDSIEIFQHTTGQEFLRELVHQNLGARFAVSIARAGERVVVQPQQVRFLAPRGFRFRRFRQAHRRECARR